MIFIVQSMAPGPNFVHVWATHAHALANEAPSMRAKRKALRTKVQRALKGGYLREQILFGILYLDFNLDAAGKFKLHQCVDRLGVRAVDVDETLVGRNFELLAALLVDEGRAVHREDTLVRGQGNWSADYSTRGLDGLDDLLCRLVEQGVIVRLQLNSNLLAHISVIVLFT